jgi:hypothetical protein
MPSDANLDTNPVVVGGTTHALTMTAGSASASARALTSLSGRRLRLSHSHAPEGVGCCGLAPLVRFRPAPAKHRHAMRARRRALRRTDFAAGPALLMRTGSTPRTRRPSASAGHERVPRNLGAVEPRRPGRRGYTAGCGLPSCLKRPRLEVAPGQAPHERVRRPCKACLAQPCGAQLASDSRWA